MGVVGLPRDKTPSDQALWRCIGIILWPSFLAACLASLLFFAAVDPLALRDSGPRIFDGLDREAGYALGLFFFWGVAACASALSLYLVRTQRNSQ